MKHTAMPCRLAVVVFSFAATVAVAAESVRDVGWFLRRMRSVEELPGLEPSHTAMSSTWDRTGGNGDGNDFKDLRPAAGGVPARNVLLDMDGPGCIHRIFTGVLGPQLEGTRIQIFLDHQPAAVFDLPVNAFFDYEHGPIPYPLVFHKSYPGTLFPIPFAKHCLVQLINERSGQPGWDAAAWGNYWQVTYTRYPESVRVQSLAWPLTETQRAELKTTCEAWLSAESGPPAEPEKWSFETGGALAPQQRLALTIPGTGVIRQMRVRVDPATPEALLGLRLQIRWDGQSAPSVDVPVGYFFGHAFGGYGKTMASPAAVLARSGPIAPDNWDPVEYTTRFNSLLLGVTDTEAYCCFPMPFAHGAVLTVINTGVEPVPAVRVRLDVQPHDALPPDWGRFQATWTHSRAAMPDSPRTGPQHMPVKNVLVAQGAGKYVGVMLSIDWPSYAWWGEGDWQIWTDQEGWPPDYHGTGSEEYFNSGWCRFDRKAVSGFVTLRPGHPTVYSFHLNDAFQFRHSIRVAEEQMGNKVIDELHPDWSTTAYWYSLPAQPAGSD